ncbi:MAG TPA: nucleic acid-binding protein [Planctomycetaceae bacterium]|nr:nucleic acid-binding protein [Planctomycetaceae bacterium]
MRKVFADTVYWIAIVKPGDSHAAVAQKARRLLGSCIIVTTDEVLSEFVTAIGTKGGPVLRAKAVETVKRILANANVRVVMQSRESFLNALELFSQRPDKGYSLTDCSSMNVMKAEKIAEILTNDHHFEQEGFKILIDPR